MKTTHLCAGLLLGITLATSAHAAMGFGNPAALNTNAGSDSGADNNPVIKMDTTGHCVAVWYSDENLGSLNGTDRDILVSTSDDYGATWTIVKSLNSNATTDSGADQFPDLALGGFGNWVVVWAAGTVGGIYGADGEIFVSRSTNFGATWSTAKPLNTDATTDTGADGVPRIATDGIGHWVATWTTRSGIGGTIGSDYDMLVARSTDNGETWTAPAALNTNAASDTGDDYFGAIETDGAGNWVAAWVSTENLGGTLGTDRDILVSRSVNNGATWSAPAALNDNAAFDSADEDGIDLSTDRAGNWVATWSTKVDSKGEMLDYDTFSARSTNNGASWSDVTTINSGADGDTSDEYVGRAVPDGFGNWLALLGSKNTLGGTVGTDSDILVVKSTNNGKSWSAMAALTGSATSDSGDDYTPTIATDGLGHWVAVWQSTDTLGDTAGSDNDIFVSASVLASGDHLKLLAPNGGEKWKVGKKKAISWASIGGAGANVKLELFRNDNFVQTIKGSTANDGLLKWQVPSNLNSGKGYTVEIASVEDSGINDSSDKSFRIKPAK